MLPLLLACAPDPYPGCKAEGRHLVIATSDRDVGALSTSSLDGTCVADAIASVSPDPFVRSLGDLVVAADRTGGDAVRLFEVGSYQTPVAEFSIGRGSNVHDVSRSGDRLVLAPYDEGALVVTDLEGRDLGTIDLSHLADADGIPEVDRLVEADGRLFAALQLLDRSGGSIWYPTGPGLLVPVDPVALDLGAPEEVGTNPRILPDPTDSGAVVASTGRFYVPDGEAQRWSGGVVETLATEAELGFDLTHVLPVGDGYVLIGIDFVAGGPSYLVCLADGAETRATVEGWLVDGVSDGVEVWVALRAESWSGDGSAEPALLRVDPATCATEVLADGFRLAPYGLALVDAL